MEIYSLKDDDVEIEGGKNHDGSKFVVTELKQGVKNPNRVNVFIDGKYEFSLDVTQVVEYKLKKGMELTAEQVAEYKKASEYGKLYQRTLEWVLSRPHSERETRDYLRRKCLNNFSRGRSGALAQVLPSSKNIQTFSSGADRCNCGCPEKDVLQLPLDDVQTFSDEIISRLKTKGYLDDERFAEWYVENRFVKKGVSRKRLMMELMKKGIKRELAEIAINKVGRDDEAEIKKIVAKKRNKYDEEKLISYLVRQGFDYQLVRTVVRENQCETD